MITAREVQVPRANVVRVRQQGSSLRCPQSRKKIISGYEEPALLAATQQMRFKRSGNQLVLYELKSK